MQITSNTAMSIGYTLVLPLRLEIVAVGGRPCLALSCRLNLLQVVYASGANGIAGDDPSTLAEDLEPLFECIVREVAPPSVRLEAPLQLLVTNLDCAPLAQSIRLYTPVTQARG